MSIEFPELPGWWFDANEISAGVYRAFGQDKNGRKVEATGLDPDALIEKCREAALQVLVNTAE
jgi:hypothetical protein